MKLALCVLAVLVVAALCPAGIKQEMMEYKQADATLKSEVFYDDATSDKRPGILVVPEWWGLNDYARSRARQLAELGYVAMAVDVYGDGFVTNDAATAGQYAGRLKNNRALLRARVKAALEQLRLNTHVDPSRTAAIGYCFGGTAVLELARSGANVGGVVSFHGGLDAPTPADTPIMARVLVCHGGDDAFVKPEEMAAFQDEMRKGDVDWQINVYGGAVHSFTNPDADKAGIQGVKYNASADQRSWRAMKQFFDELFRQDR